MKNNKSSDADGFTAEFLKFFWPDLCQQHYDLPHQQGHLSSAAVWVEDAYGCPSAAEGRAAAPVPWADAAPAAD